MQTDSPQERRRKERGDFMPWLHDQPVPRYLQVYARHLFDDVGAPVAGMWVGVALWPSLPAEKQTLDHFFGTVLNHACRGDEWVCRDGAVHYLTTREEKYEMLRLVPRVEPPQAKPDPRQLVIEGVT